MSKAPAMTELADGEGFLPDAVQGAQQQPMLDTAVNGMACVPLGGCMDQGHSAEDAISSDLMTVAAAIAAAAGAAGGASGGLTPTAAAVGGSAVTSSTGNSEDVEMHAQDVVTDTPDVVGGTFCGGGGGASRGKAQGEETKEKKKRIRNKEQLHLNSIAQRKYRERKRAEQSELETSIDRLATQVAAYKALEVRATALEVGNHGLQQSVSRQMQQINQLEDQVEKQAATIFVQMDQLSQAASHAVSREKAVQELQSTVALQEQVILALMSNAQPAPAASSRPSHGINNGPTSCGGGGGNGFNGNGNNNGFSANGNGNNGGDRGGGGGGSGISGYSGADIINALEKLAGIRRSPAEPVAQQRNACMDTLNWRRD